MANDITNQLRVKGPIDRVQTLLRFVRSPESEFDFNRIVPMPDELKKGCDELNRMTAHKARNAEIVIGIWNDNFSTCAGQWCKLNWSTCCEAEGVTITESFDESQGMHIAQIIMSTKTSAPLGVVHSLSLLFPELELDLYYVDENLLFEGKFICKNWIIEVNESGTYELEAEDLKPELKSAD